MGSKLIFTGLFFLLALNQLGSQWGQETQIVGAILFLLGLILLWFDK